MIRAVPELEDIRKEEVLNSSRMIKASLLLAKAPGFAVRNEIKYSKDKGRSVSVISKSPRSVSVLPENFVHMNAERFDFTFDKTFYALHFQIDEFGERLITKQERNMSRVISVDCIFRDEESIEDIEEKDEFGNWIQKIGKAPEYETLKTVKYFQYRLDYIKPLKILIKELSEENREYYSV